MDTTYGIGAWRVLRRLGERQVMRERYKVAEKEKENGGETTMHTLINLAVRNNLYKRANVKDSISSSTLHRHV